jgi:hypothetical protein
MAVVQNLTRLRSGPDPSQPYLAKLLAYIPAEVIAAYQAISGLLHPDPNVPDHLYLMQWVVVMIMVVLTPAWMAFTTWASKHSPAWIFRIWASPFAFAVWTFVLGGPWRVWVQSHYKWVEDYGIIASIILILVTLTLPLAEWFIDMKFPPNPSVTR